MSIERPPGYFLTHRAVVAPGQCDHLGHLNIQYYVAAMSDAAFAMMLEFGLGARDIDARRMGFAAVKMDIDFVAEVHPGEIIETHSAITKIAEKVLTFNHRIVKAEARKLACRSTVLGVCMDLDRRKAIPIPPDLMEKVREIRTDPAAD